MSPRTLEREAVAPDPVIDPRMRARRVAVARTAGRKRLRRIKVVLAIVCAVVWTLVGLRSSLVDVDRVQVVGAEHTTVDEIRAAADTPRGTPMLSADLDGAERRVAALPWVAEVRATKLWPGTVRLVVTEREPVAAVEHADGWAVVDTRGRVLDVIDEAGDLPTLDGRRSASPGERLSADDRAVLAVLGSLPDPFAEAVVEGVTTDDGIELVLDDGFRATFGDRSDTDAKADAAEAVRQHADADDGRCRIDVRVPSAPVLTDGRGCA